MPVEVLLMADVADLGVEGNVVSVTDGYARNYLFPKKLAAPVTVATKKRLEKMQRDREENRKASIVAAKELAAKMEATSYTIGVKTGDEDKMFGSVTPADIATVITAHGFDVDKHKILLDEPIKKLGVYDVRVKLHADVDATIKVWVVEE